MSAEQPTSPVPRTTLVVDNNGGPHDDVDDMLDAFARDNDMDIVRGTIEACEKCQHFSCVCQVLADHVEGCRYRLAVTCAIPISCDKHGRDVCTCAEIKAERKTKK